MMMDLLHIAGSDLGSSSTAANICKICHRDEIPVSLAMPDCAHSHINAEFRSATKREAHYLHELEGRAILLLPQLIIP